jgi:hypothetical protein
VAAVLVVALADPLLNEPVIVNILLAVAPLPLVVLAPFNPTEPVTA